MPIEIMLYMMGKKVDIYVNVFGMRLIFLWKIDANETQEKPGPLTVKSALQRLH